MAEPWLLSAQQVTLAAGAKPIDLEVTSGEIIGLAGLEGQGQDAFIETLCGLHRPMNGKVELRTENGQVVSVDTFKTAVRGGIGYLPRDRRTTGTFGGLSVFDNFAIAALDEHVRFGIVREGGLRATYEALARSLSLVCRSPEDAIDTLSGGNQQKVLLARWLARAPRAMLLNDPTRGVDVGTRMKLYDVFNDLSRRRGLPLVVLSTEIEEILQLCHRVLVFRENAVFAQINRSGMSMDRVIAAMFGQEAA